MSEKKEEDKRAYLFRFIKDVDEWGFIAFTGTDMKSHDVMLELSEKWQVKDDSVYELCHVMYSRKKTEEMIHEHATELRSIFKMLGTDVFQVLYKGDLICVIYVPNNAPRTLVLQAKGESYTVEAVISFTDLKRLIQSLLQIKVVNITSFNAITHIID